jgi:RimJ/RimL family protein N-acetyltransferase
LFRRCISLDQAGLIRVIDAVCGEDRWMSTPCFQPTPAWTHALDVPECPNHLLLVVEDEGHVVGWCRIFPTAGTREASLGIGLLQGYRDRGIGTHLARQALEWAWFAGLERVTLTSHPDNARAIHVFTRCGFGFTGRAWNGSVEMEHKRPRHN